MFNIILIEPLFADHGKPVNAGAFKMNGLLTF